MYINKSKCSYLGIGGSVLLLIGQFMPYIKFLGFGMSFSTILREESEVYMYIAITIPLIALFFSYIGSKAMAAACGVVAAIGIIAYTFEDGVDISNYLDIGFWVMLAGIILLIIAPIIPIKPEPEPERRD